MITKKMSYNIRGDRRLRNGQRQRADRRRKTKSTYALPVKKSIASKDIARSSGDER